MFAVMKKRTQTALDDGSNPQSDTVILAYRLGFRLAAEIEDWLQSWGVTGHQFNLLRILYVRDPDREGLSRGHIEGLMTARNPDVTRLLDRLETAGFVTRQRPDSDRRTVLSALTDKGWDLIERSHTPLLQLNRDQFADFTGDELGQLTALLKKALDRAIIDTRPK